MTLREKKRQLKKVYKKLHAMSFKDMVNSFEESWIVLAKEIAEEEKRRESTFLENFFGKSETTQWRIYFIFECWKFRLGAMTKDFYCLR